jgi:hypothetical protein
VTDDFPPLKGDSQAHYTKKNGGVRMMPSLRAGKGPASRSGVREITRPMSMVASPVTQTASRH